MGFKNIKRILEERQTLEEFSNSVDLYDEYAKWAYANIPDYMFDGDSSPLGDFIDIYAEQQGMDGMDVDLEDEDFLEWLFSEMGFAFQNVLSELEDEVGGLDPIPVYRAVKLNKDYLKHLQTQGKHLGIYWTFEPSKAEAYWGDRSELGVGGDTYILEAEVPQSYVDWRYTLLQNWVSSEEKEIRLQKGIPIKLKGLYKQEGRKRIPIDISSIQDKTFFV